MQWIRKKITASNFVWSEIIASFNIGNIKPSDGYPSIDI